MQPLKERFHVEKKNFGLVLQWRCEVTQVLWDSVWCLKNGRLIPYNCWAYYWCKRPLKPKKTPTVLGSEPPLFKQDKKWDFPGSNCAATAVTDWGDGAEDLIMSLIQRGICVHSLGFMVKAHIDLDCMAPGSLPCLTPSTELSGAHGACLCISPLHFAQPPLHEKTAIRGSAGFLVGSIFCVHISRLQHT